MEVTWNMEEKNQQDRLLGVNRELGDPPEERVKFEGASQGYEFSSEESEGEQTNREVEDDPYLSPLFLLLYGLVRVPLIPIVFLPY
jgi:hypothetical protein